MPMQNKIRIPNNWGPRRYQRNVWRYLEHGGKRAICIWHRRAGKDEVRMHWAASSMIDKPATYWHMLPAYSQGRKAIWTAVNPHTGKRRIDEAFPHELRANTNEQEMFIRLKNGATWQVLGSDRYDGAVGSPPYGITFSEWALSNPTAWAYLAPIVIENGGWVLFITTARGRNHAKSMLDMAQTREDWFSEVLPVNVTGAMSEEAVEQHRVEYTGIFGKEAADALIDQEYYCSFEAAILGGVLGQGDATAKLDEPLTQNRHQAGSVLNGNPGSNLRGNRQCRAALRSRSAPRRPRCEIRRGVRRRCASQCVHHAQRSRDRRDRCATRAAAPAFPPRPPARTTPMGLGGLLATKRANRLGCLKPNKAESGSGIARGGPAPVCINDRHFVFR
jgi:hypothetical protein